MNTPLPPPPAALFDADTLARQLADTDRPASVLKQALATVHDGLAARFHAGEDIHHLVHWRSDILDQILTQAWHAIDWADTPPACLVAVGGYGRGELHPHSDIDLLILLESHDAALAEPLETLVTLLWDIGLDIGHSVRTVAECVDAARDDITVATNLMESRRLVGPEALYQAMKTATGPDRLWPSRDFFRAKWDEQIRRHRKYNDTEYNLEPNLKTCPGGLRDIQMVGWVIKRHFGAERLDELVEHGFITADEFRSLMAGQAYLWRIRYALHLLTGRCEDRLLFDHQKAVAEQMGFAGGRGNESAEAFMHSYFITAMELSELNDMLLQLFDEAILRACEAETVQELNSRFRVRNGYIEVTNDRVFQDTPSALLEMFLLMARHDIDGARAATIRLIRENRSRIDETFRQEPKNQALFLEILRSQHKVSYQLQRMKRYGVLGRYIPAFGRIIGKMQYDLFHAYTVDAHTLLVIANMRRLRKPDMQELFPIAHGIVNRLPRIELLYLAGLFHDIAKGRDGDHSELGAEDAERFCRLHGLHHRDAMLVAWLVGHHLLMSSVSQRQDLSDPDVIRQFALTVGDQLHLDYLYALTVADINATNPKLWNTWKAALLRELYTATKRMLRRGLEHHVDRRDWIRDTQEAAIAKLATKGFSRDTIQALWGNPGDEYFLRETANDIAWHTEAMAEHQPADRPLVLIKESTDKQFEGATQIFIRLPDRQSIFATVATTLEQLDLNIMDARVFTSESGFAMDTFFVLDTDGQSLGNDPERIEHIRRALADNLTDPDAWQKVAQRFTPRQLKHFRIPTETSLWLDDTGQWSVLEVITPDRPGVLARIGRIFVEHNIHLQNAKITTLGERVEDIFFITGPDHRPLHDTTLAEAIQAAIRRQLDNPPETAATGTQGITV